MEQYLKDLMKTIPSGIEFEKIDETTVRIIFRNIAYTNDGVGTDITLLKNVYGNKLTGGHHVLGFEKIPFSKEGVNILDSIGGRQTTFWVAKPSVIHEISYKPDGYPNVTDSAYIDWLHEELIAWSNITEKELEFIINTRADRIKESSKLISSKRILLIGAGGTGSHIIDSLVKDQVHSIDIIDFDKLETHNTFRFPGAPFNVEEDISKGAYFKKIYGDQKTIIKHIDGKIQDVNISNDYDYAFVCVDNQEARKVSYSKLNALKIPFADTGIWVDYNDENKLTFSIRTTMGHETNFNEAGEVGMYKNPIQINELNSLNANIAVIAFKKHIGYYGDKLDFSQYEIHEVDFEMESTVPNEN